MANLSDNITPISTSEGVQGDGKSTTPAKLDVNGLTALGGAADAGDKFVVYDITAGTHKSVLASDLPGASGGEANTGSNVGGFTDIFKQKSGVDLEFKTVQSSDGSLDATANTSDVDFTVDRAVVSALTANSQSGTAYTGVLADAERKGIYMNNASSNTMTIPTNASVAYAVGTVIDVIMEGAGTTSIAGDTGVTVNGISAGSVSIQNRYNSARLKKTSTNTWIVSGDVFAGGGGSGVVENIGFAELKTDRDFEESAASWRPIYIKWIDLGALPNATTKNVTHNVSNLSILVKQSGNADNGTDTIPLPWVRDDSVANQLRAEYRSANIFMDCSTNLSSYSGRYYLEYTKTTDTPTASPRNT